MRLRDSVIIGLQVARLSRSEWWNSAKIDDFQRRKLVRTLRHAVDHVPYYRSLGIRAKSINSEEDLQRFPVLTKSLAQQLGDDLLSEEYAADRLHKSLTSGSTGEPLVTHFDPRAWLLCKYALKIRRMTSNGVGLFKHVVVVNEQSREALSRVSPLSGAQWLFRQTTLSIHDPIQEHVRSLVGRKIDAIYGFPSYFAELISYCESEQVELPSIPLVFTSSEYLNPERRQAIEDFFNARVCDVYGSTELKEVAWQCSSGRYHINFESVWAESADTQSVGEETSGDLLMTGLQNRAMPLIRYQVGDLARVSRVRCPCGRFAPVLEAIHGRQGDMVKLADGRRISPYLLTTAIERAPQISQYQIIQTATDRIEVAYVSLRTRTSACGFEPIIDDMARHLGEDFSVSFHPVEEIPRTERGKHRVFLRAPGIAES